MLASGRQWFGWRWRLVLKEKNNSLAVAATSDIPYCFNAWSPQWSFRLVSLGETNQLASGKFNCRPFFKGQRERERAICNKTNVSISEIFLFFQTPKFALALETVFSHLSVLCKFYKDYKLHSPYGLVQCCRLWKICSCLLTPNCTRNHVVTYKNCIVFGLSLKFAGNVLVIWVWFNIRKHTNGPLDIFRSRCSQRWRVWLLLTWHLWRDGQNGKTNENIYLEGKDTSDRLYAGVFPVDFIIFDVCQRCRQTFVAIDHWKILFIWP